LFSASARGRRGGCRTDIQPAETLKAILEGGETDFGDYLSQFSGPVLRLRVTFRQAVQLTS